MKVNDELFTLENQKLDIFFKEEMAMANTIGTLEATQIRKTLACERLEVAQQQSAVLCAFLCNFLQRYKSFCLFFFPQIL